MAIFHPTRASSPVKATSVTHPVAHISDLANSSEINAPELKNLNAKDVELLDAVILKAGPTASTFLTVFKAYNDVLNERGLDPHEVVYYGRLLKLGTLKGKTWSEKWRMVKEHYSYEKNEVVPKYSLAHNSAVSEGSHLTEDTFTLDSHEDESHEASTISYDHFRLEYKQNQVTALSMPRKSPMLQPFHVYPEKAEDTDGRESGLRSLTPPSYHSTLRDLSLLRPSVVLGRSSRLPLAKTAVVRSVDVDTPAASARKIIARVKERKGSVVNEDDAWKNIKEKRDEEDANNFRKDRLLERCWQVWRQGYQWILTTNFQISEARDNITLRLSMQRWRKRYASRLELYNRIVAVSNKRRQTNVFLMWKRRLKETRLMKWRNDLRQKMKSVKKTSDIRTKKDAWMKWRRLHQAHLADEYYSKALLARYYTRWEVRLSDLDGLYAIAEAALRNTERSLVEKCWGSWMKAVNLNVTEKIIVDQVNLRIMASKMQKWRKRTQEYLTAAEYCKFISKRSGIRSWKTSLSRIQVLKSRADKHITRRDDLLLRAVMRVWGAHERGRLLERVRHARLLKRAWASWVGRLKSIQHNQNLALAFPLRFNSRIFSSTFQRWREVLATHQNAHAFSVQYHSAQLQHKKMLAWRFLFRKKMKTVKLARLANRFFATRRAWMLWNQKLEEKRRERKLIVFHARSVTKLFRTWLKRARKSKHLRVVGDAIESGIRQRQLLHAMSRWTNRVIEVKLREIEVAQQCENEILIVSFKKWKEKYARHGEELSLMESYLFVKREDLVRRMFLRWFASARAMRHRRLTLRRKEDELKLSLISSTWDKWRERFIDSKLCPMECDTIINCQKNLLSRHFALWHSKTKSLPAIRFHATRLKHKFFQKWKDIMPLALQAKEARQRDKLSVLYKFYYKWGQAYTTKRTLKAVARARYLRLPTTSQRQLMSNPHSKSAKKPSSQQSSVRRPAQTRMEEEDSDDSSETPRRSFLSLTLAPRFNDSQMAKSPRTSLDGGADRAGSPASLPSNRLRERTFRSRSSVASEEDRGRGLWRELQEVQMKQMKSRASSKHSKT